MKAVIQPTYFAEPASSTWTKPVWDRELARLVDSTTTEKFHISSAALMETAGRAVADIAIDRGATSHPVIILCGQGNNGGDGLVAARVLHDKGVNVTVVIVKDIGRTSSQLFTEQLRAAQSIGLTINSWSSGSLEALNLPKPIIIDAISGVGFTPPCGGVMLQVLTEAAKLTASAIIAVDIPSGISPDDGSVLAAPLPAHETVSFGSSRPIHRLMPAATCCGNVSIIDIGFPNAAVTMAQSKRPPIWCEVVPEKVLRLDPWATMPKHAHKYDRGHVLVLGGSSGKIGAPILSALAALRSGAGWCSIAIPRGESPVDMPVPTELTIENFFDGRSIAVAQLQDFLSSRRVNAIVVGPGWMQQSLDQPALNCLREFAAAGGRVVIDAGALNGIANLILADSPLPKGGFILTPHQGEWLKLQDIAAQPPLTPEGVVGATSYAENLGCHIIYKNAAPIVVSPDKTPPIICIAGSPVLSRAGSGDVLSGIIAAHLAAGCSMNLAATRSYSLLSRAAWMAAQDVGEDAVLASDIIARLGIANRI
jgi:ADP-dependent NAD(P)H-hydrate dehydratase / NAD(P)H-hydrate epimerase